MIFTSLKKSSAQEMLRLGNTRRSLLVVVDDEKTKWTCLRHTSSLKDDALFQKFFYPPT